MTKEHANAYEAGYQDSLKVAGENKMLLNICVRLYRFIDHECRSDHIRCDNCSLFGDGVPCDLTKIKETLQELGAEVNDAQ